MNIRVLKALSLSALLVAVTMWVIFSVATNTAFASAGQSILLTATVTAQLPPMTTTPITVGDDFPIYKVQFVSRDDSLNIRSGPGAQYPIVATAYNGDELQGLGMTKSSDGSIWVPVQRLYPDPKLSGWVNRQFAVPQVDPSVYCADPNARAVVDEVIEAVRTEDGDRLAKIITPVRGLYIMGVYWGQVVQFSKKQVRNFFTDSTVYSWAPDGYGADVTGPLSEVIIPLLKNDLLAKEMTVGCGGSQEVSGVYFSPRYDMNSLPYYTTFRPGNYGHEFDWGAWAFGIDYWEGVPSLSYLYYDYWTP